MVCTFGGKVVVVAVAFIRQFWPQNAKPRKGIKKSNDWAAIIAVVFSPSGKKVKPGLSQNYLMQLRGVIQVKIMVNRFQNARVIYIWGEKLLRGSYGNE